MAWLIYLAWLDLLGQLVWLDLLGLAGLTWLVGLQKVRMERKVWLGLLDLLYWLDLLAWLAALAQLDWLTGWPVLTQHIHLVRLVQRMHGAQGFGWTALARP